MPRHRDSSSSSSSSSGRGGGGGGRWDANRFFRERDERQESQTRERRTTQVVDRPPPAERRRRNIDDILQAAHECYGPPARRADRTYNDEHLIPSSGVLIPYQEREQRDRSPVLRPRLLRRQSSLDTFDRAASRRVHDAYDSEDYGPPVTPIPIVVPRRRRTPPVHEKTDLTEIRVAEPDYYGDEVFRTIRSRDRSVTPRPRGRSVVTVPREVEVREIRPASAPRRGMTRVPKHIVHPRAIIDSGYTYEEEGNSYLIFQALQESHIEDLVSRSREIRRTPTTTEIKDTLAVGPPRETISMERRRSVSRRPIRVVESRSRRPSVSRVEVQPIRHHRRRRSSPIRIIEPRDVVVEDVLVPRAEVALIMPDRHRLRERDIRADILALDRERRALRQERVEGALEVEETLDVRREPKGMLKF
ncbi:hypothetical protein PAAG_03700 [Paracoccidioides lutzii Pb01]|uniref:DUF8035 domain-containing protein n=1 Tax=Paracoccidioides lutzii (strain ATCC MYA-826 / Pb01) TaxID=502779 RepID=C1GYV6_PARBA|nr:hypothetical protein PAAG_03700 [Paracoccidioides lutzii Pb01]EEH41779.2 hypothetical protein PAAG_03700 [Paracoccidioides lutzii Pb01]